MRPAISYLAERLNVPPKRTLEAFGTDFEFHCLFRETVKLGKFILNSVWLIVIQKATVQDYACSPVLLKL